MTEDEYQKFRHEAVHALMDLNEACDRDFSLSAWPRWDYDLSDGVLVFSEEGAPKVIADIQVVGTTSSASATWLWGWANDSIPESVVSLTVAVRDFGNAESISRFTTAVLADHDALGWELTAVASRLLRAKGAYRCPGEDGFLYVIFTDIRYANDDEPLRADHREASSMIECATHGAARSTYVCEHLLVDPEQEWFSEEPGDDNPWPLSTVSSLD